jgi:trypsin
MVRRTLAIALALVATVLLSGLPASAITTGQPDDHEHPFVGELLFYVPDEVDPRFTDPGAWFTCTGTMLSPTVIVTAGHCTYGVGDDGASTTSGAGDGSGGNDIWFTNLEHADFSGLPPSANYAPGNNEQRYHDWVNWLDNNPNWHRGTAYTHPAFSNDAFYLHDAGVVVLDGSLSLGEYGQIPHLHFLDRYAGDPHHLFEVVGYGLTKSGPFTEEGGDVRLKALVKLNTLEASPQDTFILLSNNPGKPHPGGTCFGDSGGPTFNNTNSNLVVAVTSFGQGNNPNCTGVGGAYRLDQPDDLAFLAGFGITP